MADGRLQSRAVHHPTPVEGTPFYVPSQAIDAHTFGSWLKSRAHDEISGFVVSLAESVAGLPNATAPRLSALPPALSGIVAMLDDLEAQLARVPPAEQAMRYGNTVRRALPPFARGAGRSALALHRAHPAPQAFRTWHAWLAEYLRGGALERHAIVRADEHAGASAELAPYLLEAFGNPVQGAALPTERRTLLAACAWRRAKPRSCRPLTTRPSPATPTQYQQKVRVDYGTGHELAFVVFLFCLARLGRIAAPPSSAQRMAAAAAASAPAASAPAAAAAEAARDDRAALVLVIFRRYVALMRSLQRQYRLEPAGSHGVWGLDDYCFLPFLFGASQFVAPTDGARAPAAPTSEAIHDAALRAALAGDNMYMEAVEFIVSVKGPRLAEHSPIINDISGMGGWERIASGLVRMYYAEVLGKRPVVQLLVFGSLLPWEGERGVGEH